MSQLSYNWKPKLVKIVMFHILLITECQTANSVLLTLSLRKFLKPCKNDEKEYDIVLHPLANVPF